MDNNREKKRTIIINSIIFAIYVLFQVFLAFHHEAWRDESQAWILARNSSFSEIVGLCASEGHPCLWFFVLKICSLCGLSFYYFSAISIIAMAVSAALFLWKSPFSLLTKICVLLSPIFFYYNPVICRIYALVVLLIVLVCIVWPKRRENTILYGFLVALLLQTHILIAGFAVGCLLEMMIHVKEALKKKINIIGYIIPFASLICMILELKQTGETETYLHVNLYSILSRLRIKTLIGSIYSVTRRMDSGLFPIGILFLLVCLIMVIVFIVSAKKCKQNHKDLRDIGVVFFSAVACYWGIIIFVRSSAHIHMTIILWLLLLFFVWTVLITIKPKYLEILFVICCLLAIPQSAIKDPLMDVKGPFSGSLEIAQMVEESVPDESIIAMHNDMLCTSIAAYLYESDKQLTIWDIDNGCEFKIHKWGRENNRTISNENLYEVILEDCGGKENVFFVDGVESINAELIPSDGMSLIGKNEEPNKWDEYYRLYKVEME